MVSLGFASFIRQVSMSILITMPLFGIVAGSQPIIGFNYGAKKMGRVKESLRTSVLTTIVVGTVFFILFMVIPSKIISLFSTDMELINSGVFPLRMIVLLFPLVGFQIISAGFFQSIGKAIPSIILSLTRQVLFLIPLILLLPLILDIKGIWIAFPIADFLAIIVTGIFSCIEIRAISINSFKVSPILSQVQGCIIVF